MSPRAAWRLEHIGFESVYDYVAGKVDWLGAGLPTEGTAASELRAASVARRDVPVCSITDTLAMAREAAADLDTCFVLNDAGVVLGRLGRRALASSTELSIEDAMTEGPSTVRPNEPLDRLVERMRQHDLRSFPVTTSDGRLFGLVLREEAERRLGDGPHSTT